MYAATSLGRIYYEIDGEGPPIIFVHGLGATSNVWHGVRTILKKQFRVIAFDLPGSGRSEKHEPRYDFATWTALLHELVEYWQLAQFVLVGHSMGTILVQLYAGLYPDRVSGLVLCGPIVELSETRKNLFQQRIETVLKEGMLPIVDSVVSGALTPATRESSSPLPGLVREMLLANDPAHYAAQCRALIEGSARAALSKIRCPVFILEGDQDTVTPLTNCLEILQLVPQAQICIIPNTGHWTMLEQPHLFIAALQQFLARYLASTKLS
ncbi:MAG: alpha/beta hydrolase [Gemmatales bacterium]|nr:alpha/beta hydrolase [Gemmatales bacterium]MDW7993644.1 alpha/beta hydrolase [Gemmatales bacterium]